MTTGPDSVPTAFVPWWHRRPEVIGPEPEWLVDVGIHMVDTASMTTRVVYFSSTSANTHRFVQKLELPAHRIPIREADAIRVSEPYVLIVPTYGGGVTPIGRDRKHVPRQVIRFLNDEHNRSLIRGVIAAGNTNFGESFGAAGDIVARKCGVPFLYRFELMGTPDDVVRVRQGLARFWADVDAGIGAR